MRRLLLRLIRIYQKYLSPMKRSRCPYTPTCSAYGYEAVERHGALLGGLLAAYRILRCNPFSHGGVDPVPLNRAEIAERYKLIRFPRKRNKGNKKT